MTSLPSLPSLRACTRATVLAGLLGVLLPAAALGNPPIRMAPQGVEFMCGGQRGDREMAFMERVSPRWGATLEFAMAPGPGGAMPAPVQVSVHDKYNGEHVLQAESDGPMMLARLRPGTYEVQASLGPLTLTQTLIVRLGQPGRLLFRWPSNYDLASVLQPARTLAQGRR